MEIFNIIILSLSSLLLIFVGTMRLMNPIQTFLKNSGITLNNDLDLLNELRGESALMLMGGLITLAGVFIPMLTLTSFVVGALIFLGFAVGRIVSISVDGKPNKLIMQGIYFELLLGFGNLSAFIYTIM